MTSDVRIEVRGLKELQKKSIQMVKDLEGTPMLRAMQKATLWVTADAKRPPNMPVDTGRLRASVTPKIKQSSLLGISRVRGIVGSNVEYAPYQELGTIFMKGRFFLLRSLQKNQERIAILFGNVVKRISRGKA